MNRCKRILAIEDDAAIATVLDMTLRNEGYVVELAVDGPTGLAMLTAGSYDLLLLDLMLPGLDGLEICRRVRASLRYLPIIIVSSKASEVQRVVGLEMGADDYLCKPFSVAELAARVRALLRRVDALTQIGDPSTGAVLTTEHLRIDPQAREVRLDGRPITLTAREFDLLYFFARHPGHIYTRLELLDKVWGYSHDGYEHTVNSHINRLRAKIEADPAHPTQILTVWGVGYKFSAVDPDPDSSG